MSARVRYRADGSAEVTFRFRESIVERLKVDIPPDARDFDPIQKRWIILPPWDSLAIAILRKAFGNAVQIIAAERSVAA